MRQALQILLAILCTYPILANAKIIFGTFAGYSEYDSTNGNVYGGLAGSNATCGADTSVACNSCASATNLPCNERRIYDSLVLRIEFQTDNSEMSGGRPILADSDNKLIAFDTVNSTQSVATNETAVIYVTWGQLCSSLKSLNSCEDPSGFREKINVGIDKDGNDVLDSSDDKDDLDIIVQPAPSVTSTVTGNNQFHDNCQASDSARQNQAFCNFEIFPGDSKVHIVGVDKVPTFPATGFNQVNYKKVRFYYSNTCDPSAGCTNFTPNMEGKTDIGITLTDSNFNLEQDVIKDLNNDQIYYFKIAGVDEAGNISLFTHDSNWSASLHSATPQPVNGLLDEETSCFIATATYGSPWTFQVRSFREFRNRFLLTHSWGRKWVRWYYRHSPAFAQEIKDSPLLKGLSRLLLTPLWAIAWASNQMGNNLFFALPLILIMGIMGFLRIYRRRLS